METLSIVPALTLMRPALGPFLLTLFLLSAIRWLGDARVPVRLLDDFAILAGILLAFGLFDPESLKHFLNPERPMDWIPDLVTGTFIARTLLSMISKSRLVARATEWAMITGSCAILLLPLMRQRPFHSGLSLFLTAFLTWISLRIIYTTGKDEEGIPPSLVLPVFLVLSTLAFISPLSGSLLLGQLSGGVAAVLAATLLVALPKGSPLSGVEPGLALGALVLIGRYYAEIPFPVVVALLSTFPSSSTGFFLARMIQGKTGVRRRIFFLLPALFSAVPLGVAIVLAVRSLSSSGGGY